MSVRATLLRRISRSAFALSATAAALLIALGCGDDGLGKRYPVSGKVTYKGEPVASGSISFYATNDASGTRGASGVITDGAYSLSTQGDSDGAFPGD
jgi:hypothetical protein